jgi:hypothetical protein
MCTCHDEALLNFLSDFRSASRDGVRPAEPTPAVEHRSSGSVATIARTKRAAFGAPSPDEGGAVIRLTGARSEGTPWDAPIAAKGDYREQETDAETDTEPEALPPPPRAPELVVVSAPAAPAWYELDHTYPGTPRRGALVRVLAVVMVFALAAGGSYYYLHKQPVRPIETQSLTQIVKTTVHAAQDAGSAHVAGSITERGLTLHASMDISPKGGTEVVLDGRDRMEAVIAGGYGYVRATYGMLTKLMGMPAATAARYQNQWLKVAETSHSNLGFTGPAMITEVLSLQHPTEYSGKLLAGNNVLVQGTLPGSGGRANLYISRQAPYYPIRVVFADPQKGSAQFDFSNWGEHVKLSPPAHAISVA